MSGVAGYTLVVISNGFFIIPIAYLLYKQNYRRTMVHMLLTLAIMFASSVYHVCDQPDPNDYTGYCIMPFGGLYLMDFSLSVMVVVNVLTYNLPSRLEWMKSSAIAVMFICVIYVYEDVNTLNNYAYYLIGVLIGVFIAGMRLWYNVLLFNWWLLLTVLLFGIGFIFYGIDDTVFASDYQYLHSVWHIFAAFGMWSGFYYMDLCVPTKRRYKSLI